MNSANLYINSILSHGAIPLITKPTRISNNSSTIINHIIKLMIQSMNYNLL